MKLAFCLFKYFPYGGLQRDFLRIAQACVRRGHQVQVYTLQWQGELPEGIQLTIIPVGSGRNHVRCRRFAELVLTYLQADPPDIVVGFNKMPGLDIYYAADPCFVARAQQKHGSWYRLTPRYKTFAGLEAAVFNPESPAQILLLAEQEQAQFMRYYHTQPARFRCLPPDITPDRKFPPNAAEERNTLRRELNIAESDSIILMIGSGFKTKGVDRALRALAALPDAVREKSHLLIIGQDNPKAFLRLAQRLQIASQVKFLGGRPDVPRFLWSSDLLLHPAYTENTGTVLLEAVVAGLPVLTTDVCGYANHIVTAQAGIVLRSPFQQIELNQQLLKMLTAADKQTWHNNALAYAANTDLYSSLQKAVEFIEQVKRIKTHVV